MNLRYDDFSLHLHPDGDALRVEARWSGTTRSERIPPARQLLDMVSQTSVPSSTARDAPAPGTSRNLSQHVQPPRVPTAEWAEEAGDLLFRTIFTGEVRSLFDQACGRRQGPKLGLRIRVHFDPAGAGGTLLADLPWELLFRADHKDFLGLSGLTPIVRHLEVPRPLELDDLTLPLRVLVARFNPPATNPLRLEDEERELKDQLSGVAGIEPLFLGAIDGERLHRELREREIHALHLMGHGDFDTGTGTGTLLLEGNDTGIPLAGEVLARLVRDRPPRLVVLNACSTARSSEAAPFAGVASALVLAGVPAVVAMRSEITNQAALAFAKTLYSETARGRPLEAAVAEGRLAIYRKAPDSLDWTLPVLFLRAAGEDIFPVSADPEPTLEPPTPPESTPAGQLNITMVGRQSGVITTHYGQGTANVHTGDLTFKG